ncbi:hypothetical protein [Sporolactobacillus laevolacticus]|uniref:Uncharacterized protein n=1 Tax=Sporolactobacillus laevolacticus DSM 442 TaxID=1395513 RepID=V6J1N9_9BACL|nr:hypothetical protein [Sporolactobacillus laevolacticus]EST13715.1 hypothetical protein P343_01900 [Sporolactobacillus laevolacticus DSM 442]
MKLICVATLTKFTAQKVLDHASPVTNEGAQMKLICVATLTKFAAQKVLNCVATLTELAVLFVSQDLRYCPMYSKLFTSVRVLWKRTKKLLVSPLINHE